jgi:CelD/BcsL family acetyltransferase involved in cellulose biosynthesis
MKNTDLSIEIVPSGTPTHLADLARIRGNGLPVPHLYSGWSQHSTQTLWRWCRVLKADGQLATGFALELAQSRLLPGTCIGRVDRLGRALHEDTLPDLGAILRTLANRIPRLQHLNVRVFDEDSARREEFGRTLEQAGARRVRRIRDYGQTVTLPIQDLEHTNRTLLTRRMRQEITRFQRHPGARIEPVRDRIHMPRIKELLEESFARTGVSPPELDIEGVFNDAGRSDESILLGAFLSGRKPPQDLVAFAWGRLNGDHVVYDVGGSEKAPELRHLSAGYSLIWQLAVWGHNRNATWLDLGGVVAGRAQIEAPLFGVDSFKRRFSNNERRVADEFTFIPQTTLGTTIACIRRWARPARVEKDFMNIEHEIVSSDAGLQAIERDWVDLLGRSNNDLLPLTHFWTRIWWLHFGTDQAMRIHCFRKNGKLIAVLPMYTTHAHYRGLPLFQEQSMANGHTPHTGLLYDSTLDSMAVAQMVRMALGSGRAGLTSFLRVPEQDALHQLFKAGQYRGRGATGLRRGVATPLIRVRGSWEAFFATRSQKFRKNMRNKVNRFGRGEGCRIERRIVRSADDPIFGEMELVSRNSWKGKVGTDLGSVPQARRFLQDLVTELGTSGGVHVWIAYAGPQPIAYEFHARYRGTTYPLRADFDEGHRDLSPGSVVEYTALRDTFEEGGIHLYDSCANDYWYLGNWTEEMRVHYDIEIFRGSLKAWLAYLLEYRVAPLARAWRGKLRRTAADDGAPKSSH